LSYVITPLNESAALFSLGNQIDVSLNLAIIDLDRRLKSMPFPGFIESVPAYASLAIFYDVKSVRAQSPVSLTAFDFVKGYIESLVNSQVLGDSKIEGSLIEIPVLYDGEDLALIAGLHHLTPEKVVALHTSVTYRVFMIGFLPGFAYMGIVDEGIATPRKASPRTSVPSGSVAIAGFQTGIYPQTSPGGWQLIGRTPLRIFDKEKPTPCRFIPGDRVRFLAIGELEFEKRNEY
jgi:inhibitor of KinA